MRSRVASSLALAALVAAPLALAQDAPLFTSDFPPEEFAARRAKVYDAIGAEGIALVQGAPAPEGYLRFRQSNDFYYLCGVEVPHAYLLLDGASRRATLFLPHRNERRERIRGEGALGRGRRAGDEAQRGRCGVLDGSARRDARPLRPAGGRRRPSSCPCSRPRGFR